MLPALKVSLRSSAVALLLAVSSACFAIDNPDASDRLGDFQARSAQFEQRIYQETQNQSEIVRLYAQYAEFLDESLNQAYTDLSVRLGASDRQALTHSQRQWLKFRDAEFAFIDQNWTMANFGSSSAISRNAYRMQIIKNRVVELLHYLKNYPG